MHLCSVHVCVCVRVCVCVFLSACCEAQAQSVLSMLIAFILLMDKILHDLKDSKLWELWYIPYDG